ncbi:MAG: replicative DNA helicase [Alphaproteobacteria bacterium]|nr:replicative DNA helicase [Alphaproteobacteria bacterium]
MTTTAPDNTVTPLRDEDGDAPAYRTPPHNAEIEAALLGAVLTNNRAFEKVSEIIEPGHFFEPVHGRIYEAAARLIERGQAASPLTLRHFFEKDEGLAQVGGGQYLFDLAASVVSVVNVIDYARTIHDMYLRRQLTGLGEDVVNEAYRHDLDKEATDQIEDAEQRLYDLATVGETERGIVSLKHASLVAVDEAEQAFKREGHVVGVTTGLKDLDRRLGGLHPSDLLIIAGRPSMGKTALATNIAYNAARTNKPAIGEHDQAGTHRVLFFSLEMSSEQLATRILSQESAIPSDKIRRGEISNDEFQAFAVASQEMSRVSLFIDDTPAITVSTMRTRARRLKRQNGLDLIVVDYLQLLQPSSTRRSENRVQEISEITRGLKTLAKELSVPVVALSQLSRAVEQREDKRPQLADLRESGSIEQDADVVMFIFREEYYLEKAEPIRGVDDKADKFEDRHANWQERMADARNTASVIIAKQRHGPVGSISLFFDGSLTKFADLDRHHGGGDDF